MAESFGKYVGILGDPACRPGWQKNFPRIADLLWETYQPSHVFVPGDVTEWGMVTEHEEMLEYCRKYPWEWLVAMGDHDSPTNVFERYWGPAQKNGLSQDCTSRFLAVLDDLQDQVQACFFGHIHSFDRKEYRGIPLIVTGAGGAAARGLGVDGYEGTRPFQAMALDTSSGEIHLLEDEESFNQPS
ncbi:MAG: metallophosphoesterase [Deltaproteobacteria bacterium]|nr:metallophosphoesterase [Deltaproteobacteria bacterium]